MAQYTLYLRIPNVGFKTYSLSTPEDTIKDIYRFVRDTEGVPVKMMYIPKVRKFDGSDKILDHFGNNTEFDIYYKLLAGPEKPNDELLDIFVELPGISDKFFVRHNPDDTI